MTTKRSIAAMTTRRIALIVAIATLATVPVIASEGNWKLDADHSTAKILLGTNAVNIGVARLRGKVNLDSAEPKNSMLDLVIDPAGGELITFKSRRATMNRDGQLEVRGHLTLHRIVREVYLNAAEDYYGAVYGGTTERTVTREVTFVLPKENRGDDADITAEARIFRENFPELFAAVNDVNWQPVVLDKACEMPSPSEGYAGATCTGTVVEPHRAPAFAQVGEDYRGFESEAPKGNLMTIVLKLHVTREYREQAMGR
jgi:polyisoprenoid-binding protein YceI